MIDGAIYAAYAYSSGGKANIGRQLQDFAQALLIMTGEMPSNTVA